MLVQQVARGNSAGFARHTTRNVIVNEDAAGEDYANNTVKTAHYSLLTFVPKVLFEQFQRLANKYFLFLTMLQLIPSISPINPWSSITPLVIVLATSAVKEAYEDYGRHKADHELNTRPCRKTEDGAFVSSTWREISVGEIVRLGRDDFVPCDLVLLSSSGENGVAHVETAMLDGETNLKPKFSVSSTSHMLEEREVANIKATIECGLPDGLLYEFNGTLRLDGESMIPLSAQNVLLRGCKLKNTDCVFGVAVYTGHDTKLVMNSLRGGVAKRSRVDRLMNSYLVMILAFQFLLVFTSVFASVVWLIQEGYRADYLALDREMVLWFACKRFLTFLILYSNLIPISLYVSVEVVHFVQALLIHFDPAMQDPVSGKQAMARTSNLSEELGQVSYIFSDKTGTLTRNEMKFRKCSVAGLMCADIVDFPQMLSVGGNDGTLKPVFASKDEMERHVLDLEHASGASSTPPSVSKSDDDVEFELPPEYEWPEGSTDEERLVALEASEEMLVFNRIPTRLDPDASYEAQMFLHILSLCHTVIPEPDPTSPTNFRYKANSPDEDALVSAAASMGFVLQESYNDIRVVSELGTARTYTILNTLEFDSDRKRMSVIVRMADKRIVLLCKGADTVIMERVSERSYRATTQDHLQEFAVDGLRTLCFAYRELEQDHYNAWADMYRKASLQMTDRDEKIAEVAEMIEKDMTLLGASAIEDRLQDGVPDTIANLARAGVKIWVLTGDKQETAINIGFSCKLLHGGMNLITLSGTTDCASTKEKIIATLESFNNAPLTPDGTARENALVMDGAALTHAMEKTESQDLLFQVVKDCKAVVFCRVSPKQKAEVVDLVRDRVPSVTLAIGDGGNDVSMITRAHVGVGLSGHEGMQAVLASDYAISQFRFLEPLLLVHGRVSYVRVTKLILYSFYKNFAYVLTQLWFNIYCGMSGQTLIDEWYISVFNLTFTGLPIIVLAIFDQDIPLKKIYEYPQLYTRGRDDLLFNRRVFLRWLLEGSVQSLILFFFPYMWFRVRTTHSNGRLDGLEYFGSVVYICIVFVVNWKVFLMTEFLTWIHIIVYAFSMLLWFPFALAYHSTPLFGTRFAVEEQLGCPTFWLLLAVTSVACLLPSVCFEYIRREFWCDLLDVVKDGRIHQPRQRAVARTQLSVNERSKSGELIQ